MNDMDYRIILGELVEIKKRLDSIEQASTLRANSEQSIVGPPNVVDSENPALARPATLAELKTFIDQGFAPLITAAVFDGWQISLTRFRDSIIQRIDDLDQGPIAKAKSKKNELAEAIMLLPE